MPTKPPKKNVPAPAPAAEPTQQPQTITSAKPEPRELTEIQLKTCNLAADLIVNGGASADIKNLLAALIGHERRLQFRSSSETEVKDSIESFSDLWERDLARFWPEAEPKVDEPPPSSVADEARANVHKNIRFHIKEFLGHAATHDLHFLCNALTICTVNFGGTDEESPLLEAITFELDRNSQYVYIQRDHLELVQAYVDLLNEADSRKGA